MGDFMGGGGRSGQSFSVDLVPVEPHRFAMVIIVITHVGGLNLHTVKLLTVKQLPGQLPRCHGNIIVPAVMLIQYVPDP
jgi:hypothetical protein